MFGFDEGSHEADAWNMMQGSGEEHKAKLSHEVIGAAAAYEAAKAYEDHRAANGQPDSHAKAKEIAAGLAGAFIDREFETRGLDFIDKERAKHEAKKRLHDSIDARGY